MLTQQSPSAITTKMMCPVCGDCLRLTVIEPHYNGKRLDNHIFACSKCDEIQTYVFDRPSASRLKLLYNI
jgi:C4-type Zn-finger protein